MASQGGEEEAAAAMPAPVEPTDEEILRQMDAEEFLDLHGVPMLNFEREMFLDVLQAEALVVCGRGINYDRVLINLLKVYADPGNLIFVVNASDYEERYYRKHLPADLVHEPDKIGLEREKTYFEGGIQFITTRILVVDLLKKRIPIELITGIFVLRAHNVIESCQEAFALRLYRQSNKTGFVKAFSNNVEAFTIGYGHVERVMRNLFITELLLWPRFQVSVQRCLRASEPTVIEFHIPMTPAMAQIQTCLLDLMNHLVKEIKRLNRFADLDEITVENCVTKNFHKILQTQLDTIWYRLSTATKLLISELKALRSLMFSTIYNDSVSLYAMVRQFRTADYAKSSSGWVLLEQADQLFSLTKQRVFNKDDEFEPESCPKWKALSEVLRVEIPNDIRNTIEKERKPLEGPVKVLVLCQDAKTCYQLNQYLTQGAERYLFYSAMKNDITINRLSASYKHLKSSEVQANLVPVESVDAYMRRPGAKKAPTKPATTEAPKPAPSVGPNFLKQHFLKKRAEEESKKKAGETSEDGPSMEEVLEEDETEEEANYIFRESYVLTMSQKDVDTSQLAESSIFDMTQLENIEFESFTAPSEDLDVTSIINSTAKPLVFIQTFKTEQFGFVALEKVLEEMQPAYIVMYHTNITAIRHLEVFEARQKRPAKDRLKVYFLLHNRTVEEQAYLTGLRREKQAFELLIETKKNMVIPKYQDGKTDDLMEKIQKEMIEEAHSSRQAGGQTPVKKGPRKVVVDMREFRSDLPCLIHKRGIEVVPMTLTVGDYILTPEVCIERKSISDLIGSLNTGRLYSQCVMMSRHYLRPILLIEFDQNKPFHFQRNYIISSNSIGGGSNSSNADIIQKLQLLTLHFRKLRLVWSPSPYATAQLFDELKQNRDEPNPDVAAALGSDEAGGESEQVTERYNTTIYDFLLKLPGINSRNIGRVMRLGGNLKQLLKKSEEELTELLGNKNDAKMLYEIFHVAHKPVEEDGSKTGKSFGGKKRAFGGKGVKPKA